MYNSWNAESNQKAIRDSIYRNDANLDSPDRYFNEEFSESDQFKDWIWKLGFTSWVNANISDIVDAFTKEVGNKRYDQGIEWEFEGMIDMGNENVIDFAKSLFGYATAGESDWDVFSWQNDLCKEYYSMQLENYSNLNFNILENKVKVLETIVDTYNIGHEQRKGENENSHSS